MIPNFLASKTYLEDLETVIENAAVHELKNCRVLISGGTGALASFLIDVLMRMGGVDVTITARDKDKVSARFPAYMSSSHFHILIGDISKQTDFGGAYDYIVHAASNAHPRANALYPVETMTANLTGTLNLLEFSVKATPRKFLFISSAEIYGKKNSSSDNPIKEEQNGVIDLQLLTAAYPESKRAAEALCTAYFNEYNINTISIRPWYIYGPTYTGESTKADVQFLKKALAFEDIVLKSDGMKLRSYCYISDFTEALVIALKSNQNGALNIGGKDIAAIRDFAKNSAQLAGTKVVFDLPDEIENKGYSPTGNAVIDDGKIRQLGYNPKVTLFDGIERTLKIRRELRGII